MTRTIVPGTFQFFDVSEINLQNFVQFHKITKFGSKQKNALLFTISKKLVKNDKSFHLLHSFKHNKTKQTNMVITTYTLTPQSNTLYHMTWNSSNVISQSSATPSYPYQYWNTEPDSTMITLANPKDSHPYVFEYAKGDGSNFSQTTISDSSCIWILATVSVGPPEVVSLYSNKYSKYLACNSDGSLTMFSTLNSSSEWSRTVSLV
jgi:hypothetical protein